MSAKHTAEWKAALDAVQGLDFIGKGQKIGYWGVSMGTRYGVPFVAAEPRVTCAIFGLFPAAPGLEPHTEAARSIKIPLLFVLQWNDELFKREQGLALFEAFGSEEKTLHMNPGPHTGIPPRERASWGPFWKSHLGEAKVAAPAR
jgi:dienelactone hydrolase